MLYVTPDKYRSMGYGIDLTGIEDIELASTLDRAAAIAEAYCSVPMFPNKHSFFGGTVTGEQHDWTLPESPLEQPRRRIWPDHWPIESIQDFKVKVTNTQYVQIGPSEIFINNADRYIEVVSLAFTGIGLFGALIPSIGLMRPVAEVSYTYGWTFQASGELLFPTDARTYRAANQFWYAGPDVYINGVLADPSSYTVDSTEGTVTFNANLGEDDTVTADYTYKLPTEIRDAVGHIATFLLSAKQVQARGMGGLQSIKVGDVSMVADTARLTAENLSLLVPEAAWLLAAHNFITVR